MSTEQTSLLFERPPREAQCARVLDELKKGRGLTKWIMIHEIGILNGGARIEELRHGKFDGVFYPIEMEKIEVPNSTAKVARYFLVNENQTSHDDRAGVLAAVEATVGGS